jgi:hypothetical protein
MDTSTIFQNVIKLILKADSTLTSKGSNKKLYVLSMIQTHLSEEQQHLLPVIEIAIDFFVMLMKSPAMIQLENQCYTRCF